MSSWINTLLNGATYTTLAVSICFSVYALENPGGIYCDNPAVYEWAEDNIFRPLSNGISGGFDWVGKVVFSSEPLPELKVSEETEALAKNMVCNQIR